MSTKTVLICQNRACRRVGSAEVLAAFQSAPLVGVAVVGCCCLGQCGNGPTVLVMPEQIWYHRVHPDFVPAIVARHLQ